MHEFQPAGFLQCPKATDLAVLISPLVISRVMFRSNSWWLVALLLLLALSNVCSTVSFSVV